MTGVLAQFKGCSQICCFDLSQPGHATRVTLEPALVRVSDLLWFCFPSFLSGDSRGPAAEAPGALRRDPRSASWNNKQPSCQRSAGGQGFPVLRLRRFEGLEVVLMAPLVQNLFEEAEKRLVSAGGGKQRASAA